MAVLIAIAVFPWLGIGTLGVFLWRLYRKSNQKRALDDFEIQPPPGRVKASVKYGAKRPPKVHDDEWAFKKELEQ